MKNSTKQGLVRRKLIAVAVSSCFAVGTALANPTGHNVVRGTADIHRVGNLLQITNSPNAIINWQSFSIGANETTRFIQQSPASAVLNRVVGGDPSAILGALQSNGRVFLINPNGILFGSGARVDVGGLVASTLRLADEDFLAGRMNFRADPALPAAAVVNQGRITAGAGGQVFLVGTAVDNQGVITVPNGDIVLAAGNSVRVTESPGSPLQVEIAAPADRSINLSETLYGSRGLYGGLIRNSGTLNASSAVQEADGRIVLKASHDVTLESSSRISANGTQGGSITVQAETGTLLADGLIEAKGSEVQGGRVELLGEQVGLMGAMELDVSGRTGGGTVLVGGDFQGRNPDKQNAERTHVAREVEIRADAGERGDGGKVIVWADGDTRYYGSISARGGKTGGDGGFVETSGKGRLDFQGTVDTRAPSGSAGTLLLDPTDITISTAVTTPTVAFAGDTYSNVTTTPSNLNVGTLTAQLGSSNVIVTTASPLGANGDITVNNAINYSATNSLTLNANRTITIVAGSGGINNAGSGTVTLTGGAAGSIAVNESITTNGGAITLTSGTGGVNLAAAKSINAGSGRIAINSGGGAANLTSGTLETSNATAAAVSIANATTITLGNVALTGGGTLILSHTGNATQTAGTAIRGSGGIAKAGAGTLTLSQVNTYTGPTNVAAGMLSVTGGNAIANTGAVTLAGGATLNVAAAETIGSLSGAGNVTLANTLTTGDSGNTTLTGVISGGGGLVKQGAGTFTLEGTNTYAGATNIGAGTLALSGATGAAANTASVTVGAGATLRLDNSGANNTNRLNDAATLTMTGGELAVLGNAGANTTETMGALTLSSSYSTVTLTPDAATNTQVTFASLARTAGASGLFRGTNLGANTIVSQIANSSNIAFTAAPTLTGGGGNSGTTTVSIVGGAIGAGGASGATSPGTDFITYNPPTGSVNGLRPLLASEYAAVPAANVNLRLIANASSNANFSINSLLLSGGAGGIAYDYDSGGGANTITLGGAALSGNVLSLGGGTNVIQPTVTGATLAFGNAEAKIFAVSDLVLGSRAAVTGTGGVGKSGAGVLREDRSVAIQGGLTVNSGTLRSGVTNAFSTAQALTVRPFGTFDLNGFNNNITTLTLNSGGTSGAAVTTGAGTLTLGNNVTLNVIGSGETGATVSGNLALGAATRTFTVNNGAATIDLSVSATISGAGGLTKAGAGTLALSATNTYTGATTITAGVLSANTLANGGVASSIGQSTSAVGNLVFSNGAVLQYTGASTTTDRNFTLAAAGAGVLDVTGAGTNLTLSGASNGSTGGLTKLGSGTLTLSGVNAYTGLTTVSAGTLAAGINDALASGGVSVSGGGTYALGTFSDTVGAVTLTNGSITGTTGILTGTSYAVQNGSISAILAGAGGLTKTTAGTVTLSGANTYTGITAINAGMLNANTLANGGVASSIGASTNLAANLVLNGGMLRYTGGTASTDRNYTLTGTGSIDVATPASSLTISGASAAGAGALTKLGSGTLVLTGANVNTGATTIREGTLQIGDGGATGALGTGGVTNIATLVFNRNNVLTVPNVISSFGAVTQAGSGTTTLSGANTYTGLTTVSAGTLALGANNVLSNASSVVVDGGAFDINTRTDTVAGVQLVSGSITGTTGVLTSASAYDMQSGTASAILAGAVGLNKTTTGTVTLSGANTYTGATAVSAGALAAASNTALGTAAGATTVSAGAELQVSGTGLTIAEPLNLNGTGVGGGGALRNLANANSVTGAITLQSASRINSDAGTLTLSGAGNITGAFPLTVGGAGDTAISKIIATGAGTLTKDGGGTLTLSGVNTYTGLTTVSAGTLALGANNVLSNASSVVVDGGTFDINTRTDTVAGVQLVSGSITGTTGVLTSTSTYDVQSGAASAILGGAVGLSKTTAGTVTLSGANTYTGATTVSAGTLVASNAAALGATAGGTTVSSGATLNINNVAIGSEAITIDGNGAGGTGALTGTDAASLGGTLALTGASRIGTTSGASTLAFGGAVNAGGNALDITGAGNVTATNALNNFGTVTVNGTGDVTLVDANALTIGTSSVGRLSARTLSGDLTLAGNVTATGSGDTIVLAAAANFDNTGGFSLAPGAGRWLVYSTSPAGSTEGGLTAAAGSALPRLYNRSFGGNPPGSVLEPGNHLIYSAQPALVVTPDNKTKVYGTNDPAQTFVTSGFVNDDGVLDTAATAGLTGSFGRFAGETVTAPGPSYAITQGTFTSDAGYGMTFDGTRTLTITAAALGFSLATPGQTKVYGADDPAPGGVGVTLAGLVNNPAIVTWNGNVAIDDSSVTGTLTSLTRAAGETVAGAPYAIIAGSVTLSGSDSNYAKTFDASNSPTLTINQSALSITANAQSKTYGAADPVLSFGVAGLVNATATDWNGNGTPINDTAASALGGALVRAAGETVAASPYAITQGTLAANANYAITAFTSSSLAITPAPLTITANNAARPASQPNPPFSASYSGFQFGETPVALTGTLNFTTPATPASLAGSYPITPFGQSATNYAIAYVNGTLTVGAVPPQNSLASLADSLVVAGFAQLGIAEPYARPSDCVAPSGDGGGADRITVSAPGACGGASMVIAVSRQPRGGIRVGPNGEILLQPGLKLQIAPTVDMGSLRGATLQNPPAAETAPQPGLGLQIAPALTNQP